jgi:polysaccharide deacetylase family protein (PEP-CTERM system associated)
MPAYPTLFTNPTPARVAAPFLSVVVPVRNEARHLAGTLRQLLTQTYDAERFEILVADGRSTDATGDVVRTLQANHANLYLLDNPQLLSSAGRNRAIEAARGDIIVIIDGHCDLANANYLNDLVDAFARSGADCIGRPQPLDVSGGTLLQRTIAAARASRLGHNPGSHIYSTRERFVAPHSVAVAYRREVFAAVGLFDEAFDACEDVEFNHRVAQAGFTCFFTPQARVYYHPRATLGRLFWQMVRYGRGRIRLMRKHREMRSLPCLVPAAFVLATLLGVVLAAGLPWLRWPFAGLWSFYLLMVFGEALRLTWRSRQLRQLPLLPAVFATIHAGAGTGVLAEACRWRRSVPRRSRIEDRARDDASTFDPPSSILDPRSAPFRMVNALTIDVEDYFHVTGFEHMIARSDWEHLPSRVVANTHKILAALDRTATRATFFVLGWVADRHPELVETIRSAGHEIGCHSYWHRLVYQQTPDEFRQDLCRARDALQDILGERVVAYRAPSFSITRQSLWALDILIEEGFTIDSSIYPTVHDRYGLAGTATHPHRIERPGGELWELPLSIRRLCGFPLPVGGGGYFRLYPYWFTRRALQAINSRGEPFVTYLHPWEFDPEQPRFAPGRLRAFRHYVNLHRTAPRLDHLLRDFRFGPVSEVLGRLTVSGSAVPTIARAA